MARNGLIYYINNKYVMFLKDIRLFMCKNFK